MSLGLGAVCTIIEIEKEKEKRLKVCNVLEKPVLVTAFIEKKKEEKKNNKKPSLLYDSEPYCTNIMCRHYGNKVLF